MNKNDKATSAIPLDYTVTHAFICDSANTDTAGRINALGITESVAARTYPMHQCSLTLVITLKANSDEQDPEETPAAPGSGAIPISITLLSEHGVPMGDPISAELKYPVSSRRSISILRIRMVHFPSAAKYFFDVTTGDRRLVRLELNALLEPGE